MGALDEQIVVRISSKERKELENEAEAAKRKLSDYIRLVLLGDIKRPKK